MSVSKQEALYLLWQRGHLKWKLHEVQKTMHENILASDKDVVTVLSSRRLGKSFMLCLMASELCLQKENMIVKYICPEKKMVKTIIEPILRTIFKDCPEELKPELKVADGRFLFHNGSQIQFAGSDAGNAESIRGGASDMCIVDEAGFCDDLEYVINSVLAPTLDTTGGKIVLASTPSKESNHEFIVKFVMPAEASGELMKYTIYDNPMMTADKIERILKRYPEGKNSPMFRREYLCEVVLDESRAVVPEFTSEVQSRIIKEWEKPILYDCYVAMDIGFKDFTVVLFAYNDFLNGKLVICDELVLNGPRLLTPNLAKEIREKEKKNFSDPVTNETFNPTRISDNNNLILLQDLYRLHSLNFLPTAKDNKDAAVNQMRDMLANEKIIITPNCKALISHLKHATWNNARTSFDRAVGFGHYDAVDSITYLTRNVRYNRNPYREHYGKSSSEWHLPREKDNNPSFDSFRKMFKVNNSK